VFAVLIGNIEDVIDLENHVVPNNEELRCLIKTLEFISITPDGLDLLFGKIGITVDILAQCFFVNKRITGDKNLHI